MVPIYRNNIVMTRRKFFFRLVLIGLACFLAGWVLNQARHNQDLQEFTQQADKLEAYIDWERNGKGN